MRVPILNLIVFSFGPLLVGCATLLPREQRTFAYTAKTKADKGAQYDGTLLYLAKNMGNAAASIQFKDKEMGQIVTPIIVGCKALEQPLDPNDYDVKAILEIKTDIGVMHFTFENILTLDPWARPAGNNAQMISEENVNIARNCLEATANNIVRSLQTKK